MVQKNKTYPILSWDQIQEKEDEMITYLLYLEGKSIDLVSRIRNLSRETVENHIIHCKNALNLEKQNIDDDFFIHLLASTKEERIKIINFLNEDEKLSLINYLMRKIPLIHNADDKMIALWIAGELKDPKLLPTIHKEINHKHGGVRRMVCSALGKIGSSHSIDVLHKSLQDVKPQVRQYAANALKTIGNEINHKKAKKPTK